MTAGESTRDALHREMQEEVVGRYSIRHPAICSENFFRSNGRAYHEICIYYTVVWESDRANLKTLSHEVFRWIGFDQLENYVIKPSFLKERLGSPMTALEYVIHRDI